MFYKMMGVLEGVLKNFTNFSGKYWCKVQCERKSLVLCVQSAL